MISIWLMVSALSHRGATGQQASRKPRQFLVGHLTDRRGDLDEKDLIYAALVRSVQAGATEAELASALLWLGLWPGLDAIFRRRLSLYLRAPEELVSEISDRCTQQIHHVRLEDVQRQR
ncbi:MAG: hypothetical protein IPK13_10295 [Deltaproteobacteria bacterium]|nr:hypothetical protein [Deltaproteobacteria bacterium]